jgi:DNA polymerase-3 subunit chi
MTRVTFYLVDGQMTRLTAACRVIEKAYQQGLDIFVHTASPEAGARMDQLLWSFRQGSFVPHARVEEDDPIAPVMIGAGQSPPARLQGVLVNLADEVPMFFSRFRRLLEFIGPDESDRQAGRSRFKFYRDRGYPIETHEIAGR